VYFADEDSSHTLQTKLSGSPAQAFKASQSPDNQNGTVAIQARRSAELLDQMDIILDDFGVASQKFVQFIRDYQGHFNEFQQAVSNVSTFASEHHGQFQANTELISLIGYARGAHAEHACLTAAQIPGKIMRYREQLRREGAFLMAIKTTRVMSNSGVPAPRYVPTTRKSESQRIPQTRLVKGKQPALTLNGTSSDAKLPSDLDSGPMFTPDGSSNDSALPAVCGNEECHTKSSPAHNASSQESSESTLRSASSSHLSKSSFSGLPKPAEYDFLGKRPNLKHGGQFLQTPGGQIDQVKLLKLKFKHKEDGSTITYTIDPPADWTDKKQVYHAQKIAQQYIARKSGSTREDRRPSYHADDTQWIIDYMTANTQLTKAEARGVDWKKLSQSSQAIKKVTADYNARECVVSGEHPKRTEIAIFQKITRMPQLRPLRGMPEKRKKRKSYDSSDEEKEEGPTAKRGKSDSKDASDRSGRISAASLKNSKHTDTNVFASEDTIMDELMVKPATVGDDSVSSHNSTQADNYIVKVDYTDAATTKLTLLDDQLLEMAGVEDDITAAEGSIMKD
jgi:hypothetical protein